MAHEFKIERAVRSQAKARIALTAPSGAGKTWSALLLAKGMVEYMLEVGATTGRVDTKVGMIDTERKSGQLYAHLFAYDVITLEPPYSPERYLGALHALEAAGKEVIIIDQGSHAWAGMGGLLEIVDQLRQSSNQFDAWKEASPEYAMFIETILASPSHIIFNMRAKTAYVQEQYTDRNGNQKTKMKKLGMKPIMREGIEYEFTTALDLEVETHIATATKDRTGLFARPLIISEETGKQLAHWLLSGQALDEGVDRFTPLQKAEGAAGAGKRAMQRAVTLPDLAREFKLADDAVRAFKDLVAAGALGELRADLVAVKDARKVMLTTEPSSPPPPDAISFDEAVALEDWVSKSAVSRDEFLKNFELPRYTHLPEGRLQTVVDWVDKRLQGMGEPTPPLPPSLAGKAKIHKPTGALADLEDDIPF